jgi:hypothetical protein
MHGTYKNRSGVPTDFDLDAVALIVASHSSGSRPAWSATLVYVPATQAFVELRSSPPDIRGYSQDEAEEVDAAYVQSTFHVSGEDMARISANPSAWRPIDRRSGA